MIPVLWLVLFIAAAFLLLLPLILWLFVVYQRYSGSRLVSCPQDQSAATVHIDLAHVLETAADGSPDLCLADCTHWPDRANCDRKCLSQAAAPAPYPPLAVMGKNKQIYHLPIFLAAFAAWCLGAFWHAQYLFRPQWMQAAGLTHAQIKQMVWWIGPHLLTASVCLLFAYGVAWLLALFHRKGVLQGILMSVLLGGAVAAASAFAMTQLPRELLAMEAGYALLAALTVGAIVGGLFDKLVLSTK